MIAQQELSPPFEELAPRSLPRDMCIVWTIVGEVAVHRAPRRLQQPAAADTGEVAVHRAPRLSRLLLVSAGEVAANRAPRQPHQSSPGEVAVSRAPRWLCLRLGCWLVRLWCHPLRKQ